MFAQTDSDNWKADIDCYKCDKKGHLARACTKKKTKEAEQMHATIAEEEGQDLDEGENIFVQNGTRGGVNRSYVLLDNQSTTPIFWQTSGKPRTRSLSIATTDRRTQT